MAHLVLVERWDEGRKAGEGDSTQGRDRVDNQAERKGGREEGREGGREGGRKGRFRTIRFE